MKKFFLLILSLSLLSASLTAQISTSLLFSDNMVLQREIEVPVWGWAEKGSRVEMVFQGKSFSAKTDKTGKWIITLPEMSAGGPYDMIIRSQSGKLEIKNILVGDVWVCSGQSNMAMTVDRTIHAEEEIKNATDPGIRHFRVPTAGSEELQTRLKGGSWIVSSPETTGGFSATAYYFARELRKHHDVPIGLINNSWGGSRIEAWMSAELFLESPLKEYLEKVKSQQEASGREEPAPKEYHMQCRIWNQMVNPMIDYRMKGVIWYQGESNAGERELSLIYRDMFSMMIADWRKKWDQGDFPFLFVQLANFREAGETPWDQLWPVLRESQSKTLELSPNTAQAVIIDIGEAGNIHPQNKQDVGYRLSLGARKLAYNEDIVYSGPVYKSHEISGPTVDVFFDHVGSGLLVRNKYGYLNGFALAGEDRQFMWAKAKLKDGHVVVWSDRIPRPVAVRYGWADNPDDVNLYSMEGLPASPFRTDNW